jgi:hypothetical protein
MRRYRQSIRLAYYLLCVLVPLGGVFFLGKSWFLVVSLLVLGVPLVNWLTRTKQGERVDS